MQLRRGFPVIGVAAISMAIACSDSGSTAPNGPLTTLAAGQTDTSKTSPTGPTGPTGPTTPPPDTATHVQGSSDPRQLGGSVVGIGPATDTANYQKVAGATVVLSLPADAASGGSEVEIARTTSGADGSFSLGTFKLGRYALTVTPPASGPYKGTHWTFLIDQYSSAKVDLTVWLGRK